MVKQNLFRGESDPTVHSAHAQSGIFCLKLIYIGGWTGMHSKVLNFRKLVSFQLIITLVLTTPKTCPYATTSESPAVKCMPDWPIGQPRYLIHSVLPAGKMKLEFLEYPSSTFAWIFKNIQLIPSSFLGLS